MQFEIIQPTEALRPYITRYVFVRADGSTDTMTPPQDDPRFVDGKHVQPLLPNYGSLIFMRNVLTAVLQTTYEQAQPYTYTWFTAFNEAEQGTGATNLPRTLTCPRV